MCFRAVARLVAIASVSLGAVAAHPASQTPSGVPHVYLLDAQRLVDLRRQVRLGEADLAPAWAALRRAADAALAAGPFSVVDTATVPPSGDTHDYMSRAPYWWPNPKTPKRLPYVRRDGERNPEIDRIPDHRAMNAMVDAVETLALAAYLGGDERHAAKAARLLRAWFLDPATHMNPHLQYAQAIPGVTTGRGIGLIETRGLTRVVEAVGLLESTPSWRAADGAAIRDWFARFLRWMRESANGKDEADERNNHGTYYDLQMASFALFTGQPDLARDVLRDAREKRIASQIEPDGRQPLELARTRSWSYSVMNLDGLTQLAVLGERVGVDLWIYRTTDGRSLRAALMYLAPYAFGERAWTHQQLGEWTPQALFPVLRRAGATYRDAECAGLVAKLPPVTPSDRSRLSGSR